LRLIDVRSSADVRSFPVGFQACSSVMTGLQKLGPEPFSFRASTAPTCSRNFKGSVRPIKAALLDQAAGGWRRHNSTPMNPFFNARSLAPQRRSGSLKPRKSSSGYAQSTDRGARDQHRLMGAPPSATRDFFSAAPMELRRRRLRSIAASGQTLAAAAAKTDPAPCAWQTAAATGCPNCQH